jgi:Beta-1,3-glucanase
MKLTIVNDSPGASKDIWFVYYGLDPANNGKPSHLADPTGRLVPNVPSEKPTSALAIKAPTGPFTFPMLNAARMYISIGEPLALVVDAAGNPIPPSPQNPTDPNYNTTWDFFEITYIPNGANELFNFNLSNVQSANLPLAFHVSGVEPSNKQPVDYSRGWVPGDYSKFKAAIGSNTQFSKLILPGTERVLAPGTAIKAFAQKVIQNPLFDADYLKSSVDEVWEKFETTDLIFIGDPAPNSNDFLTWTGRVKNGQFTFTTNNLSNRLSNIVLNKPTTLELFENDFLFCASGCGDPGSLQANYANQLCGTLCAAFNRSMMLKTTTLAQAANSDWCKATAEFYQAPITNHYAKEIHANSVEGRAYAFQSDDHCDVSSYVAVSNPTQLTITFVAN